MTFLLTKSKHFKNLPKVVLVNLKSSCQTAPIKVSKLKMELKYPLARRDESVNDCYHGVTISDPYRWLEDPSSKDTEEYINEQNKITFPYLHSCVFRDAVQKRFEETWNYEKYSCPERHGDKYFYQKNSGLQNQSIFYVQNSLRDNNPKVFLDPNKLSSDGTVAVSKTRFSENGATLAYSLSTSGSDWNTIQFMDVETQKLYPEILKKVKFSDISWTHDNKGIFYCCYPTMEQFEGSETTNMEHQKLYYHFLGTDQKEDILITEFPDDPSLIIGTSVSNCGNWLVLEVSKGCKNNIVLFCKLKGSITDKMKFTTVVTEFENDFMYVTTHENLHYFLTDFKASKFHLMGIDFEQLSDGWKVIIPEDPKCVLSWVRPTSNKKLVVSYLRDVVNVLQLFKVTGEKIFEFPLEMGTITGFWGKKNCPEIFYKFASFLTPGIIYYCNVEENEIKPETFLEMSIVNFEPNQFETKQVFYASSDGTKIPMFIVKRKKSPENEPRPCLLKGYGGFGISYQPSFSIDPIIFIEHLDGIYAVANIRGGGEYGMEWHNGGRLKQKQNSFNDFIAAAEYLIAENYTKQDKLVINGGSNGGLLIGACINQRPDLFGAAIIEVGVLDMLRFHKFTIGYSWSTDYGNSDDKEMFEYLLKYSPLHNVNVPKPDGEKQYPATLILTGDHDDRVVPLHSLKFIAQMHYSVSKSSTQKNPILIRVDCKSGHGHGKPTSKRIEECTDKFCFILNSLQLKFKTK